MKKLGELKEIDIRTVWKHEQSEFSRWLSEENNINKLGDLLGITLEDVRTEFPIGDFRCDIICKNANTGNNILIENQLEQTNHDHLGKIITYASGLDASVVIWIVKEAREEHKTAIEWLNKHTDEKLSFFLIEVHTYYIGESLPAPMFKIIEKPNDFTRFVEDSKSATELNRLEFWKKFNGLLEKKKFPFNKRQATTDHWYDVAIGVADCHISIDLVNREHKIRVGLLISDNKDLYDNLYANKTNIESIVKKELHWEKKDDKKKSLIYLDIPNLDFNNQNNYLELMEEVIEDVLLLKKGFQQYLNKNCY